MREETGLLREIPNVPLVQWQRWWEEGKVAKPNVAIIRFLDSSDAG
jgi:hypothetical protein